MRKRPTSKQLIKLKEMWFLYGNNGVLSTNGNHKMLQRLVEQERDSLEILEESLRFYNDITAECFYDTFKTLIGIK